MKHTLGEVRESTIKMMEEINARGMYEISPLADNKKMLQNAYDAIQLRMKTKVSGSGRKVFNFKKLQDLQCKLVLVSGDKQVSGGGVVRFLQVSNMNCMSMSMLLERFVIVCK